MANHDTPTNPFTGPPPLAPPTPEEVTRADSDAQVLHDAADTAAYRPDIPQYLRRPLADWFDAAAHEATQVGSDPHAVAAARALLDAPPAAGRPAVEQVAGVEVRRLRAHVERLEAELDGLRDQAAAPGCRISNTLGLIDGLVRRGIVGPGIAAELRRSLTTSPKPRDLPSPHAGAAPMVAWPSKNGPLRPVSAESLRDAGGAA